MSVKQILLAETIEKFEIGLGVCCRSEDRGSAKLYLASLAPLLAKIVLDQEVRDEIAAVERMFGHTWLLDAKPFEDAFDRWRQFCKEYRRDDH